MAKQTEPNSSMLGTRRQVVRTHTLGRARHTRVSQTRAFSFCLFFFATCKYRVPCRSEVRLPVHTRSGPPEHRSGRGLRGLRGAVPARGCSVLPVLAPTLKPQLPQLPSCSACTAAASTWTTGGWDQWQRGSRRLDAAPALDIGASQRQHQQRQRQRQAARSSRGDGTPESTPVGKG